MMRWFNILLARLRALLGREAVISDIDEEMRLHIEMETEANIERGMSPAEARRAALRSFGNLGSIKDVAYQVRGGGMLEALLQDVRYGARVLAKHKGFTAIAVLTLALGVGANTAIFSVVNTVLMRPLPFPNAERLVTIKREDARGKDVNAEGVISLPNFSDFRAQAQTLQHAAAYSHAHAWLTSHGGYAPERLAGVLATADLFKVLGVEPAIGRTFTAEEDVSGAPYVAVISHGLWQRLFGSDPKIIGREIILDGDKTTVVGVMPPGFNFPIGEEVRDFWAPLGSSGYGETLKNRRANNHLVIASLKPDATIEQAQAELDTINSQLAAQYPEANAGTRVHVANMHNDLVGDVSQALLVLLSAVGFVLLIACANVANLLLARATSRGKEIAIRTALGATRWRVIRQLLTESLLLSIAGGGLGLVLALWVLPVLVAMGPGNIPRLNEISLDVRVLIFTLTVSVLTGIAFGLVPALRASRLDLNESLKEGSRGSTGGLGRSRMRSVLVISEIALSLVLLVSAGLLIKSFMTLINTSPGYDPSRALTATLSVSSSKYPEADRFFSGVVERTRALPGVEAVGVTSLLPLSVSDTSVEFKIDGRPEPLPGEVPAARPQSINAGYFQAMGIPVQRGRAFTDQDRKDSAKVVIINETLARIHFGTEDPLGKRLILYNVFGPGQPLPYEIIGIVGDIRHRGLRAAPTPEYYISYLQMPAPRMTLIVRSATPDVASLAPPVRSAINEVDKEAQVWDVREMDERVAISVAPQRFNMMLLSLFALIALVLAATGILSVMSFTVAQRTHEIGIRMALGAQKGDIFRLIIGQGMLLTLIGTGVGLISAFALTRLMSSLLFGVGATDPATFAIIVLILIVVSLVACYIPARRATQVDPMIALRYE